MPKNMLIMLMVTMLMLIVVMTFSDQVGGAMNVVFQIFNFGYEHPVVTLMVVGVLMITLSTVIRSFMTDMVKQQKNQSESRAFQAELRKARMENNLYKIKKLTEMQQQMMAKNMEGMQSMMKTMPLTMVIIIPIFAWLRYFVKLGAGNEIRGGIRGYSGSDGFIQAMNPEAFNIAVPWAQGVPLYDSLWFFPNWMLIYILVSIPIGQLINRLIRTYLFRKRLREIESQEPQETAEVL